MNSIYTAVKGWRSGFGKSPAASAARPARAVEISRATHFTALLDPINTIYGAVRGLLDGRKEGVVIQVVSATSGEGASTVARALAEKAATLGNLSVFLMDGNDTGQGSAFAAIKNSKSYVNDAAAPLMSDAAGLESIYAACRRQYQLTIVDCPSVQSGKFFETLPKLSDGIILVVEAEKLRPAMVRQVVEILEQQNLEIFGVVLNKTREYIPKSLKNII